MNSINRKEWFTASEIAGMGDLPEQASNVTRRATKNNWLKRQVEGKRGVAFEYHYTSLPESVQQALGFKTQTTNLAARKQTETSDEFTVSRRRLITAIDTVEEILEATHKTMRPAAKAQMILMVYELLAEESANEKIVEMIKLIA